MFKLHPRVQFIGAAVFVVVVLAGVTLTLTLVLRTPPAANGGSPTFPPPVGGGGSGNTGSSTSQMTPIFDSAAGNFRYGAVQTHTDVCSRVGSSILAKHKGNAMDAAIATVLCVGVVNAHSCGIGGGFFMTLLAAPRGSTVKEVNTVISREVAPLNATEKMYVNTTDASVFGGLAVGVPGEVAGLHKAWQLYGSVAWRELVEPTARLLEEGYRVEKALGEAVRWSEDIIRQQPQLSEVFVKKDGTLIEEGDIFTDQKLAKTFRTLADDPMSFYNGTLARAIVDDIQDAGGIISLQDLSTYTPRVRAPLTAHLPYANLTVYAPTAPASGAILQYILRLVDGIWATNEYAKDIESTILTYHRLTEVFKFAYAKRSALGDEEFANITEIMANLTSEEFVRDTMRRINDSFTQPVDYYGPAFEFNDQGTSHLSVVAPDGSAVALTSTINHHFGSKVRGSRTGIMFNNEMDDFSTPGTVNHFGVPASPSNFIQPGKMPMSSMVPSIFLDGQGKVKLVTGGSGGTRITSQTAEIAVQYLYMKKSLKEATDTARVHHQLVPNVLEYEAHLDKEILDGLRAKGHEVKLNSKLARIGSVADICDTPCTGGDCFLRKCLYAVSDGRKGGSPDGF